MTDPRTARELVIRAMNGRSARALAVQLDISERTVRSWLAGTAKPGYDLTMRMIRMVRELETA